MSRNKQDKKCFGRFIRSGGFADNISQLNLVCLLITKEMATNCLNGYEKICHNLSRYFGRKTQISTDELLSPEQIAIFKIDKIKVYDSLQF